MKIGMWIRAVLGTGGIVFTVLGCWRAGMPSPSIESFASTRQPTPTTFRWPTETWPPLPTRTPTPICYPPGLNALRQLREMRLEEWQWQELNLPGHRARHLPGSPLPVFPVAVLATPDGPRLHVEWKESIESFIPTAAALLDEIGNAHRWLYRDEEEAIGWSKGWIERFPDGRWLWASTSPTTRFLLTTSSGTRIFEAPVPMMWVRWAGDEMAFAAAADSWDLWRLDLRTGRWEKVPRGEGLGKAFLLAPDRSAGFGSRDLEGRMEQWWWVGTVEWWRVVPRWGAAAERLGAVTYPPIIGRGGTASDTGPIGDSPYWVIGLPNRWFGEGFLVDLRRGEVVSPTLIGLPADAYFLGIRLAPDGRWVAFELPPPSGKVQGPKDPGVRLYVAPAGDLRSGFWLEGMGLVIEGGRMVGWGEHPRFLVVEDRREGGLRLVPLPPSEKAPQGYWLAGARLPLAVVPGGVVTAGEGGRVMMWDARGQQVAAIDLRPPYEAVHALLPEVEGGKTRRVWIGAQSSQPTWEKRCTYGLIEWTLP